MKKPCACMQALEGFKKACQLGPLWEGARPSLTSDALAVCLPGGGAAGEEASFPDLSEALKFFEGAFDHELPKREGRVMPAPSVDPDYDHATQGIKVGAPRELVTTPRQCGTATLTEGATKGRQMRRHA